MQAVDGKEWCSMYIIYIRSKSKSNKNCISVYTHLIKK